MTKFNSARDELLYAMTLDGWANESDGNVEAPTGFFARISNDPQDVPSIRDAFPNETKGMANSTMVGHFLMKENSQGFVYVTTYPDSVSLIRDFRALEAEFSEWDSQEW